MPHIIANVLMGAVRRGDRQALAFVGPGFLDSTRIAQSDAQLWIDIFLANRKCLLRELKQFRRTFDLVADKLAQREVKYLLRFLSSSAAVRKSLEKKF